VEYDFEKLGPDERYKILVSTVVPRPIAWITTVSKDGVRNAAPFSFFNAMGRDPPIVAIGFQPDPGGGLKDTAANILDTGEFVVNLVPEIAAAAMSQTSLNAPPHVDELELAGVETLPSVKVKPPRIAASPVAFECRVHTPLQFASGQLLVVGEVVQAHVADDGILDSARTYIDTPALKLVGRMEGRGVYLHTRDTFEIERPPDIKNRRQVKT